jgi:hypothetical protein
LIIVLSHFHPPEEWGGKRSLVDLFRVWDH